MTEELRGAESRTEIARRDDICSNKILHFHLFEPTSHRIREMHTYFNMKSMSHSETCNERAQRHRLEEETAFELIAAKRSLCKGDGIVSGRGSSDDDSTLPVSS